VLSLRELQMAYLYHPLYNSSYSTMDTILPSSPSNNPATDELLQTSKKILRDLTESNKASQQSLKIACAKIFQKLEKLK
jgi:hypothetical protein